MTAPTTSSTGVSYWISEDDTVTVQNASEDDDVPEPGLFYRWVDAARESRAAKDANLTRSGEVTVRLVTDDEMRELNFTFRQRNESTNVLSFPFEAPPGFNANASEATVIDILGDVVISTQVVRREAAQQSKDPLAHFAHMTVHGVLHLMGMDHIDDDDARLMELAESHLMSTLGFKDPWAMAPAPAMTDRQEEVHS